MPLDWVLLLRVLHVTFGALWFGAVAFSSILLGPAIEAAGDQGKGFMASLQKRGGFARFMGPVAGFTLLTGLLLYWAMGYVRGPFATAAASILTVGAILSLVAWTFGIVGVLPLQKRMGALGASFGPGGPTPEQAATMKQLGSTMATRGKLVAGAIILAFLLMVGRVLA